MPFKTFNTWLFDGNLKSDIPNREILLKYNSPITSMYAINIFLSVGKLNYYLNQQFNNVGLWYLDREELFKFIKKCVKDFKVQRNQLSYIPYPKRKDKIWNEIRSKFPTIKNYEVTLLCNLIEKNPEKEAIYTALGIEKSEKKKTKKEGKKEEKKNISLKELIEKNFSLMDVEFKK
jgi:hypothetical protein